MKTKIGLLGILVISLLVLTIGCSSAPQNSNLVVSCNEFSSQNHLTGEIKVPAKGTLTVILCSNPTTGFSWGETAEINNAGILKQVSHEYISPQSTSTPSIGAAGQDKWVFKALEKGTAVVSFSYSRPWEGGEKGAWTYTLTVTVE